MLRPTGLQPNNLPASAPIYAVVLSKYTTTVQILQAQVP